MQKILKNIKNNKTTLIFGFLITLVALFISFEFYTSNTAQRSSSFWLNEVDRLHTKSIDTRMRLRGTKLPSTPLAIIGIDERALQAQGRFPWSRKKIATLVEELYKNGAHVVATDIMFTEKSNEELQKVISSIPVSNQGSDYARVIESFKNNQLRLADADSYFAKTIQKYQDRFVLSATYDHLDISYQPYQLLCYNYIYEQTPFYAAWENEGYDINTKILATYDYPEAFTELTESLETSLQENLESVRQKATQKFCEGKFSYKTQSANLSTTLSNEQCERKLSEKENEEKRRALALAERRYCSRWLVKGKDEFLDKLQSSWSEIREKEEIYTSLSFEDFLNGMHTRGGLTSAFFPADFWSMSIPLLDQATRYTGFLNAHPDTDGTIRKSPLVSKSGDQHLPSLAFRTAMVSMGATGARVDLNRSPNNESNLDVLHVDMLQGQEVLRRIPVDEQARIYINYAGPGYTFPHVSAKEFFETENPNLLVTYRAKDKESGEIKLIKDDVLNKKEFLKGKTVIIGGTAIGIYDLRVTPFDENFRGVETHINIIDNIMREDYLYQSKSEPLIMSLLILGLGFLMTLVLAFLGAIPAVLITIGLGIATWWVDSIFFFGTGVIVAIIFPIGTILFTYLGLTIYKYFTEEKNKKELKGTFGKYVSPAIVEEILADPANIELGGRKERVTVFFSDVRGFTTISETLDASDLSDLLNEYLTPMTDIIFENKGTLDKYIGDAIMAFFGAPITHPDHAKQACRAALQNIERLTSLRESLKARNLPDIDIGIGLNTGEVSVGNMGSNSVRNYTIMGDSVNLGARLEGITKQYGVRTIISEFTQAELDDTFFTREVDWVKVKGKNKPVRIFELVDYDNTSDDNKFLIDHFNKGFDLYHKQQWQRAIETFEGAMKFRADDSVCKLYLERCQNYLKNPPPADWDGVFTMTTK